MLNILIFILIVSILIIAHEFGHFLAARQAKVKVEIFAIGFGPPLLKFKRKATEIMVCLFPLGGYVKLAGDNRSEFKGSPDEFLSQPAGVKMRIVFAGPLFNYILAFFLFWIIAFFGFPSSQPVVGGVEEGYPASEAGIEAGDTVVEVEGEGVGGWAHMARLISGSEDTVSLTVLREGREISFVVPLREKEMRDDFGKVKKVPIIGITPRLEKYNFVGSFFKGGEELFRYTANILKGFAYIFLGRIPFKEAVAGPLGIYYITTEFVKVGPLATLFLMTVLNITLALVNLFPLPVLDGGHLMIFFFERIRKKQLSEKTEEVLTRIGFVLIGLLLLFVFYNDLMRFGPKIWKQENGSILKEESERLLNKSD